MTNKISKVLTQAWENMISDYKDGTIDLQHERITEYSTTCTSLESSLIDKIKEKKPEWSVKSQGYHGLGDKNTDIQIGCGYGPRKFLGDVHIELKLYHDTAAWKKTPKTTNTVQSDLQFAKEYSTLDIPIWVGVIDTIPSTNKQKIPFDIDWKECNILEDVFEKNYKNINPPSSPPREKKQRWFFVNGSNL